MWVMVPGPSTSTSMTRSPGSRSLLGCSLRPRLPPPGTALGFSKVAARVTWPGHRYAGDLQNLSKSQMEARKRAQTERVREFGEVVGSANADVVGAVLVEGERAAGGHDHDGERLLDEGRPGDGGAGAECSSVIDRRVDEGVAEVHRARALAGLFGVADSASLGQLRRLGGDALGDEAHAA